jgi:hypothetical protein
MMQSGPARHHVVCRHCGLGSAASLDHASARECIAALEREVVRLRERLRHGRFSVTGLRGAVPDPANGVAASPQLLQVR